MVLGRTPAGGGGATSVLKVSGIPPADRVRPDAAGVCRQGWQERRCAGKRGTGVAVGSHVGRGTPFANVPLVFRGLVEWSRAMWSLAYLWTPSIGYANSGAMAVRYPADAAGFRGGCNVGGILVLSFDFFL